MRKLAFLTIASLAACSTLGQGTSNSTSVVTGEYRYIDGDRLIMACGRQSCSRTLIRDGRLSHQPFKLIGSILTLKVRVVDACGPESTQVACAQSDDGKALRIIRWIRVQTQRED